MKRNAKGRWHLLFLCFGMASIVWAASELIYDENADPKKEIAAAVAEASRHGKRAKHIALVFGANWCLDCRALDKQMHAGRMAALLEKHYMVVKIDVGRMDKNLDVASKYHVPIKNGIPAVAILDSRGKLLHAQEQGQFTDARHMTSESFQNFFEQWKPKS